MSITHQKMHPLVKKGMLKTYLAFFLSGVLCTFLLVTLNQEQQFQFHYKFTPNAKIKLQSPVLFPEDNEGDSQHVQILYWTECFSQNPLNFSGVDLTKKSCLQNCTFHRNRSLIGTSDAVIFHAFDLGQHPDDFPSFHKESQVWIYLNHESPLHFSDPNLTTYGASFNWTMTYRRDSDILHNYFNVKEKPQKNQSKLDQEKITSGKTKLVAWFVSHCNTFSKREEYVKELSKHITVDVYGKCGNLTCPGNKCWPDVGQRYKFYISFENALCMDYITEKFSFPLLNNVVPIAMSGGDYKTMAPPGSYIDVEDFNSPKDLANYLKFLDQHTEKYLEYFQWKDDYSITGNDGWCELCRKLVDFKLNGKPYRKVYPDLESWWKRPKINGGSACSTPKAWKWFPKSTPKPKQ